jgi:hypothetical protein
MSCVAVAMKSLTSPRIERLLARPAEQGDHLPMVQGPWQIAATGVPTSKNAFTRLIEPPLIGALGLLVACWSREPIARFSVAGMVFNTLSLVRAVLSIVACSTR